MPTAKSLAPHRVAILLPLLALALCAGLDRPAEALNPAPVPGDPNHFVSTSTTQETLYDDTPVAVTDDAFSTTVDALLNGHSIFTHTFALPFADPAVQAAVTQVETLLAADGAAPGLPNLTSSLPTTQTSTTTDVTGTTTGTPIITVTTNFGPGTIVVGPVDTAPINFTLLAGQEDTTSTRPR